MSHTYGSRTYGAGIYGGYAAPFLGTWPGATVDVFDATGARKGTFQTGVGDFLGCEFTHTEKGCSDFLLMFGDFVDIEKKDVVKIKLFDSDDYFFCGVVRVEPIQGATQTDYVYSGYGLNDYLYRINAGALSYANKTIEYILDDLLTNNITAKTPITYNVAKLQPPAITLTSFNANYNQMDSAIDALLEIASSAGLYVAGVDRVGDFFFLPRSDETQVTLVTGAEGRYGIDDYNPADTVEARTKYFVLDKDGVFVDTVETTEDHDIFEEKLTGPDVDNTTLVNWAEGILKENEITTRSASIRWQIWKNSPQVVIADGNIRIISNILPEDAEAPGTSLFGAGLFGAGPFGGYPYQGFNLDDTLRIIQVTYRVTDTENVRDIQLGNRPPELDKEVLKIRKDLTDLRVSLGR